MRKAAVLIVAALGLWGCFAASPDKTYFQIHLEAPGASSPAFDKILLLERPAVADLYDDFRILYRLNPYEVNYYAHSFWAEKPSPMIRSAVGSYLLRRRAFRSVFLEAAQGRADWILRLTLNRIEEIDAEPAWRARLAMEIEVIEAATDERLAFRRFDRSEPLPRREVAAVPPVLSRILAEELEALLAELRGK
jgi:ABC-type uncharacterized transport system auxiliary subunit